jgi:hypothetical protein
LDYYIESDERHRLLHGAPPFPEYITQGDLSQKGPEFLIEAVTLGMRGLQYLVRAFRMIPVDRRVILEDMVKGMRLVAAGFTKAQEERLKSGLGLSDESLKRANDGTGYPRSVRNALALPPFFPGGPGDPAFPGRNTQPGQRGELAAPLPSSAKPQPTPTYFIAPDPGPFHVPYPYGYSYPPGPPPQTGIPRPPSPQTVTPTPAPPEPEGDTTPPAKQDKPAPPPQQPPKQEHQPPPPYRHDGRRGARH